MRAGPPSMAAAGASKPLSGPTRNPPSTSTAMQRRSVPTPGSTTARTTPSGRYCTARTSASAPARDVEGGDVVGDVDDPQIGRDVEHDRVTHADELVDAAVVGEERDERRTIGHQERGRYRAQFPDPVRVLPRLGVARREVRVDVGFGHPERSTDPYGRQLTGLDEPIHGHRRHAHQCGDFLHRQKARLADPLPTRKLPTPAAEKRAYAGGIGVVERQLPLCVRRHIWTVGPTIGSPGGTGPASRARGRSADPRPGVRASRSPGRARSVRIGTTVLRPLRAPATASPVGRDRRTPRPRYRPPTRPPRTDRRR